MEDDVPVRVHRRVKPGAPWAPATLAVVSIIGAGMAAGAMLGWLYGIGGAP